MAIALLAAAVPGIQVLRRDWGSIDRAAEQQAAHESFRPSNSPIISSLSGIAVTSGGGVLMDSPRPGETFVAFVVHDGSLQRDLEFWQTVQRDLGSNHKVQLVGYCDGLPCSRKLRASAPNLRFPVVGYTEYHTARVLDRADAAHCAVVLDAEFRSIRALPWTASSQPGELASTIASGR